MGDYLRRGVAEFVGTFALVFIGAGSIIYGNLLQIALAHGLVIFVMVSAVGYISGGHFNPAVTFAFVVTRRIAAPLAGIYWAAQLLAAIAAAFLLKWLLPGEFDSQANLGAPQLASQIDVGQAVVFEAILTFFLVWVIFATAVDPRGTFKQIAGLAIGMTITLDILLAGGFTGAMMNPARSLGPELAANHWGDWWVWIVGPLAGATIAAVIYEGLYLRPPRPEPVGPPETGVEEHAPGTAALD